MIANRLRGTQILKWLGKWSVAPFGLFRFPLPDLGEKIKEGKVKKLYVREGDRVEEFQKIADVESDKQFT
jgi:multidrug efflux pump subunit AcrA (membrane-fusion protein)